MPRQNIRDDWRRICHGSSWRRYILFHQRYSNHIGFRRSPHSVKLLGGITHLAKRAPMLGGNFALWGLIYSSTECALIKLRHKDDSINSIVGGFTTGYMLSCRGGWRSALSNGIIGAIMLGAIEFLQVINSYQTTKQVNQIQGKLSERFSTQIESSGALNFNSHHTQNIKLPYYGISEFQESFNIFKGMQ